MECGCPPDRKREECPGNPGLKALKSREVFKIPFKPDSGGSEGTQ